MKIDFLLVSRIYVEGLKTDLTYKVSVLCHKIFSLLYARKCSRNGAVVRALASDPTNVVRVRFPDSESYVS